MEPVKREHIEAAMRLFGFDELAARRHVQQRQQLARQIEQQQREAADQCRQRWADRMHMEITP